MRTGLLHRLAFGIWAIEPSRAQAYYGLVSALLSGKGTTPTTRTELQVNTVSANDGMLPDAPPAPPEREAANVLVLAINDVILKRGDECTYGMEDVADILEGAERDDTVQGIVLSIDSPGGEGSGMMLLAQAIGRMSKPVVAHINHGMAASAAYGIAAACNEVYASSPQDLFGSCGTYVTLIDMASYMRAQGAPVHEVYATLSTDKNGPVREALLADSTDPKDPHYTRLRTEFIDPFNQAFINMLLEKRPQMDTTAEKWQGGKLFYADEALRLGLIDGYATQAQAVQRVRELAAPPTTIASTSINTNTNTMKFSTLFNNALVALGLTEEKPVPTAEDLTKANEALAETKLQLVTAEQASQLANLADYNAKVQLAEELRTKFSGELAKRTAVEDSLKAALQNHGVELKEGADVATVAIETLNAWASETKAKHTSAPKEGDDKPKPAASASFAAAREAGVSVGE